MLEVVIWKRHLHSRSSYFFFSPWAFNHISLLSSWWMTRQCYMWQYFTMSPIYNHSHDQSLFHVMITEPSPWLLSKLNSPMKIMRYRWQIKKNVVSGHWLKDLLSLLFSFLWWNEAGFIAGFYTLLNEINMISLVRHQMFSCRNLCINFTSVI